MLFLRQSCPDKILVKPVFFLALQCCEGLVGNFHYTSKGGGGGGMGNLESSGDIL